MTLYPCGCDTDELLPCELHLDIQVAREGASLRTADELCLQFVEDAMAVAHDAAQRIELAPWGRDVVKRATDGLASAGWLDDRDLADDLRTLADQIESELAGLDGGPYLTHWEDGFLIYRATGPLAEEA